MKVCIVAMIALGLLACASAPPAPEITAPTLAYVIPPVNPATYLIADTTRVAVEAQDGRNLNTTAAVRARAAVGMHLDSIGMLASVRLVSVSGAFEAAGTVTTRVDSADVPSGATLLRMSARGVDSTMHAPHMSRELLRVTGGGSFFHHFFTRLPGGPAEPGYVWTDTVTLHDDAAGIQSRTRTIMTSSLQGDTVIDGRTVRVIASRLATLIELQGVVDGMQVRQQLTGTGTARTLWDDEQGLLLLREETSTTKGTLDLPALEMRGVPVQANTRRLLRLQP